MSIPAPEPAGSPAHAESIGITLAFTAGYVDTLGFVALFGLFTAHVTGNFVLIGSELARPSQGVLIKLLAFPAFIFAVVVARLIVVRAERKGRQGAPALLALQAVLLLGFMSVGWLPAPVANAQSTLALVAGVLGAAAMGTQNAASRLVWSTSSPTTVMTGNVTQLTIDLVDLMRGEAGADLRQRVRKFLWPVIGFGAGAVLGALAYRSFSFLALSLPIGLTCALIPLAGKTIESSPVRRIEPSRSNS